MQPKFTFFRIAYRQFIYRGFDVAAEEKGFKVTYNFEIPDLTEFHPVWHFPFENADLNDPALRGMLFNLGMTELVSYWKCCCPPEISVECGSLTAEQISFWKKLYFKGLGEYFYRNGIETDIDSFVSVVSRGEVYSVSPGKPLSGALIPVGGGKDSAVTLELTKGLDMQKTVYAINPHRATLETSRVAGFTEDRAVFPKRSIDSELIRLNKEGFLNGHTPFSAIVAFSSLICAYLKGRRYVVLSNESSANEATVGDVNHQYSKSLEFERDFREYTASYLNCGVEYFSLLRPFTEIRIAQIFSEHPEYFPVFLSCNLGSKTDSWCSSCPKCLFVYLMLLPFAEYSTVNAVFNKDMANDPNMLPDLRKLLGLEKEKPFECVGSKAEANLACHLACAKFESRGEELPLLLREYKSRGLEKGDMSLLEERDSNHFVPDEFLPCLDSTSLTPEESLAAEFAGRSLAILGFGREGLSTYRYYRSHYPNTPIVIADKRGAMLPEDDDNVTVVSGKGYIDACKDSDMVMITPGIPQFDLPEWILPKLTSQTRLFLKHYGRQTIGITGTKGKSTCSSLIAAVTDNSVLVGNIGKPVFDSLDEISPETAVVYELSCHQLEGCESSPALSVVTNLFEEHLDHYGSFDRYYSAKKNIFKNLPPEGLLIYDLGNGQIAPYELPISALAYSVTEPSAPIFADGEGGRLVTPLGGVGIDPDRLNIKGTHNLGYAAIACFIAKKTGVSDEDFLSRLYDFRGLPHRLELVAEKDGVRFYDDSISTIPQATAAGIESLKDVGSVIIGGMERNTDLTPLADYLALHPVDLIILIPETGERFNELLISRGVTNAVICENLEEAVKIAKERTERGRICLFSPAAASYHLYKNFEERGDHFKALVKQ